MLLPGKHTLEQGPQRAQARKTCWVWLVSAVRSKLRALPHRGEDRVQGVWHGG